MGEAVNDIKIRLINRITLLEDAQLLGLLEKLLSTSALSHEDLLLLAMAVPVRAETDLEALKREQNYQGPDRQGFEQVAIEMNIEEPIEDLMAQLTP